MAKNTWIADAIASPGAFTKKAKAAGKTVPEMAADATAPDSKASAKTKKQAVLAKTLAKLRGKKG